MRRAIFSAACAALTLSAVGASAAPAPAPAPAATQAPADPITADVNCLLIGASMAGSSDQQEQTIGSAATFFYLGRLQGRLSDGALEDRMFTQLPKLNALGPTEPQRCVRGVGERKQGFEAIGDRLEKRLAALPGARKPTAAPPAAAGAQPKP